MWKKRDIHLQGGQLNPWRQEQSAQETASLLRHLTCSPLTRLIKESLCSPHS